MVESVIDEVAGLKAASTKQTLHLQHYNDFLIYNNYYDRVCCNHIYFNVGPFPP